MVQSRSKEPRVESFAMGKRSRAHWESTPAGYDYDSGVLHLPEGTVSVQMQGNAKDFHLTRLDFVSDRRHYIVTVYRRYSRRGVIGFARRMLVEAGIPN